MVQVSYTIRSVIKYTWPPEVPSAMHTPHPHCITYNGHESKVFTESSKSSDNVASYVCPNGRSFNTRKIWGKSGHLR